MKRDRQRARAITKAQRKRRQDKPVNRAIQLLVGSGEPSDAADGITTARVAPGEWDSIRPGDSVYASPTHPGYVTGQPQSTTSLGTCMVSVAGAATIRLRYRG